jgi:hypothetical protein
MKPSFKILADQFSTLNEQDNKAFISFYVTHKQEIESLQHIETEEELYLLIVINHVYGRSLLYETREYKEAEKYLEISKQLILQNRDTFDIELQNDVWYLQTLLHLLRATFQLKEYEKSREFLKELKNLDKENPEKYAFAEKELSRIKKNKFFTILIYCGLALMAISVTARLLSLTDSELMGRLGTLAGLIGLTGSYFTRASRHTYTVANP